MKSGKLISGFLFLAFCLLPGTVKGQNSQIIAQEKLEAGQTYKREIIGTQTHRYSFELKLNEFFQVRVEQKGVDVALKLLDASGNVLATMDSPNGKEGSETLTFVAAGAGDFILEIAALDAKAEKGTYILARTASRAATAADKRRVEIERLFVEAIAARDAGQGEVALEKFKAALAGWEELKDDYLADLTVRVIVAEINTEYQKADAILKENFKKPEQSKADSASAKIKFQEALEIFRSIKTKTEDENLKTKITRFGGNESQQSLKNLAIYTEVSIALALDRIAQTHYYLGEWNEYVEYKKLAVVASQYFLKFKADLESQDGGKKILLAMRSSMAQDLENIASALYSRFGQLDESIKYAEQAVALYQTLYQETQNEQYKIHEAFNLAGIAFSYNNQSKYVAKAIENYTKSLEIFRTIPKAKSKVAEILSVVGSAYMSLYDYPAARRNFEESLKIYQESNNKHGQARILNDFAVMYLTVNNKPKFEEYIKQTLEILEPRRGFAKRFS